MISTEYVSPCSEQFGFQHGRCTGLVQWEPEDWAVRRCFCLCHGFDTSYTPERRAEQLLTGQEP